MTKLDAELLRQIAKWKAEGGAPRPVRVLLKYSGDLDAIKTHGFTVQTLLGEVAIGLVSLADLEALAALDNVVHIEAERYRRLNLKDSVPEINAPAVWSGVPSITGKNVVVGIVDTGIDIFHNSFRNPDGSTRILFLWDQTLSPQGAEKSPPAGFVGGVEFNAADINAALAAPNKPFRHFDVDGHGTHVAGTAAGNGSQSGHCHGANTYIGVAPQASLIIVKAQPDSNEYAVIPSAAPYTVTVANVAAWLSNNWVAYLTEWTTLKLVSANPGEGEFTVAAGVYTFNAADAGKAILINYIGSPGVPHFSNIYYLTGVAYIFQRAQTAGPNGSAMPAVVNLSLGGEIGPHDGTSHEETTLDGLIGGPTTGQVIVVSAGNDGGKDKTAVHTRPNYGLHAAGTIFSNQSRTLTFVVQPNDFETDYLDLWYSGTGVLSVTLTSPSGASVTADAAHPNINQALGADTVSITWSRNNSLNQKHEILMTISPPPPTPPVPPATKATRVAITTGQWTIRLKETAGANVDFDCWIALERSDFCPYFIAADQDLTHTITTPGSATNVITVGAYNPADSSLAEFSSRGPTPNTATGTGRQKPDICGPGVGIFAPKSGKRSESCCCDCCLDFYVAMEGTSQAAPHVTGVVALMLQKNSSFNSRVYKSEIQATGRIPTPIPDTPLPNNDWGYGKIDAEEAVHAIPGANPLPHGGPHPMAFNGAGAGGGALGKRGGRERLDTLPLAALWPASLPTPQRLRKVMAMLHGDPMGQLVAALISNHFDEVFHLINSNRRIAMRWHCMHGPLLIRELVRAVEHEDVPLLPAQIAGDSIAERLSAMLVLLARYGSPALRIDVERYSSMALALPGMTIGNIPLLWERSTIADAGVVSQTRIDYGYAAWNTRTDSA
jgi:subtilisin family serine protease